MEQEILERIKMQDEFLQKIYISSEKTRKYLMWTFYGSIAIFVVPLIGIMLVIPTFLSTLSTAYGV